MIVLQRAGFLEFNPCHDPESGRFSLRGQGNCGGTQVGITSARPGRANREVFAHMREFEGHLKALPGVSHARVQPGLGAWEGGSEPTWVVSYRGNGAARKLIARTAQQFDQDGVLLSAPCRGRGCDASVELAFERAVDPPRRQAVHDVLTRHGMAGWTWLKQGGRTTLRMVSVPAWGGERGAHLTATRDISRVLARAGLRHRVRVRDVKTSVMTKETYAAEIGG